MKRSRLAGSAASALARNRSRTAFMTLGTLIGVTALIVVVAYGRGTENAVLDNFSRMFSGSTIMLSSGGASQGGPHGAPANTLTLDDLDAIAAAVPEVELIDPMLTAGGLDIAFEGTSLRLEVAAHSENHPAVWNRGAARGAYFGRDDVGRSARVAVVGEKLVAELFGGIDPIGEMIRIGDVPFEVLGVLEPVGIDPHGIDRDREVHVPITTSMRRLLNVDYVGGAKLAVDDRADLQSVVLEIENILRPRHGLGEREPNDFRMFTPVQVEAMIQSGNRVFTLFLPLVAAVSIVVGGLVVANLMLMGVHERRAEIGLRKAVGAKPRDISAQFLLESAAVTGLGGVLALGAGFAILRLLGGASVVARGMGETPSGAETVPFTLPWEVALSGVAIAVLVGLVAGVVPARRAAGLDPVETLR
ncbi:MAG: ABC transporter permease [Gemmatimonadota bacterium]|nr:ABC transporter permease [Gemmatimonadota bacterium]